jgi:hypothetical protein
LDHDIARFDTYVLWGGIDSNDWNFLLYDPLMAIATAFSVILRQHLLLVRKRAQIGQEFTQANKERYKPVKKP